MSEPIESKKDEMIDLHEVGLFINSLNAMEGRYRHEGNYELEAMLRKTQEIINAIYIPEGLKCKNVCEEGKNE